jgi:prolyl 4-hydroxylase
MDKDTVTYAIMDPTRPAPAALLENHQKEGMFMEDYYNRTGIRWRHFFGPDGPRGPPELFMWPAEEIGQRHLVESTEGHWTCTGDKATCQAGGGTQLELEVVSQTPRVFIIEGFLSDFEADEIIRIARPLEAGSQVGNSDAGGARKSDTRTSKNAWIPRQTSKITEAISRRAADVLQIDEALLGPKNAEDLQVVHYHIGQKYDSHHDWGVSGYKESRFITILFYLTDMENPRAGGETAFPKGANGTGFKVHPGRGGAVLFYNLLEDGNGDDLALHAALPVNTGEKWLANYWVWDPKRK